MRKLIVSNIVSLDGYYEGPGKDVLAVFGHRMAAYPDDVSFDEYNIARLRAASTLLLGKTSFVGFRDYWPNVWKDPNQHPTQHEISRLNNAIDKVAISDTLTRDEVAPWDNTTIFKRADALQAVADLKAQDGGDILVFGSRTLWNYLLVNGLVDEVHLLISPVVVGGGTPAFQDVDPRTLTLIETHGWPGSGLVLARYAPFQQDI